MREGQHPLGIGLFFMVLILGGEAYSDIFIAAAVVGALCFDIIAVR